MTKAHNFRELNFDFDHNRNRLVTRTSAVYLRSKLWRLFITLIQHRNELLTREQLIQRVWNGNQLIGDYGLTHSICKLRQIIRHYELNVEIITIAKAGYLMKIRNGLKNKESLCTAISL